MEFKDKITALRKETGLSQDEMAEKLFVTRQAVSRWETGKTIPGTDMLLRIAGAFGVSTDALLGAEPGQCQSCGMLFVGNELRGSEPEGEKSALYCNYCYEDGRFAQDISMDEMIEHNLADLEEWNAEQGLHMTKEEAAAQLRLFLPTLKRWQKQVS